MPDDWELFYSISDPTIDEDDDGYSNLEEFTNGTNPNIFDLKTTGNNSNIYIFGGGSFAVIAVSIFILIRIKRKKKN